MHKKNFPMVDRFSQEVKSKASLAANILRDANTFPALFMGNIFEQDKFKTADLDVIEALEESQITMTLRYGGFDGEENMFLWHFAISKAGRKFIEGQYWTGVAGIAKGKAGMSSNHFEAISQYDPTYGRGYIYAYKHNMDPIQALRETATTRGLRDVFFPIPPNIASVLSNMLDAHYYASEYTMVEFLEELYSGCEVKQILEAQEGYRKMQEQMVKVNQNLSHTEISKLRSLFQEAGY